MTHMVCQINAYDVMGDVFIHATITDHDQSQGNEDHTHTWSTTIQGTGEDRQPRWLRDALVGLLEVL